MNRDVLLKAVQKAQSRGLDPSATVELIEDYLEIAGEISLVDRTDDLQRAFDAAYVRNTTKPVAATKLTDATPIEEAPEYDDGYIELTASSKKRLATPPKEWVAEDLFNEICKYNWYFEALPEGFKEPLIYRGTPVLNPRGMAGVGVVFACVEVVNPRELPLFFPLTELKINPEEKIEEVKRSVESLLKVRKTPVPINFSKITAPPALPSFEPDPDGAAIGGMI